MGKFSDARMLGGIGSILQIIPFVSIVGYILTLVAVKRISDELHDGRIFADMIYAVVAGIVGVALGFGILVFGTFGAIFAGGFSGLITVFSILGVVWIALIISSIFVRKAFNTMAQKLNIGHFRTAATLYFIGALLTIVFVGFIILFIAYIFQIVAFFSIDETAVTTQGPAQGAASTDTAVTTAVGTKYCSSCGAPLDASVSFCPKCGAKQT